MPNADAKNNPQELLMQIEAELRQIHAQIDSINATIRPWQDELVALKDYRKQLIDLHEATQRRSVKPRVVTVERKTVTTKITVDSATTDLIAQLKKLSQEEIAALCNQFAAQNGELDNTTEMFETEE